MSELRNNTTEGGEMNRYTQEQVSAINRAALDDLPPTTNETTAMCQIGCGPMTLTYRTLVDMDGNQTKVGGLMRCPKCHCGYNPSDIDAILRAIDDEDAT